MKVQIKFSNTAAGVGSAKCFPSFMLHREYKSMFSPDTYTTLCTQIQIGFIAFNFSYLVYFFYSAKFYALHIALAPNANIETVTNKNPQKYAVLSIFPNARNQTTTLLSFVQS